MATEGALRAGIRKSRRENALNLNLRRVALTALFVWLAAVRGWFGGQDEWLSLMPLLLIYAGLAAVMYVAGKRYPLALGISRRAVLFLDLPIVFAIQWMHLPASDSQVGVVRFTLALFVLLIMLAAFTMDARYVIAASMESILLYCLLAYRGGDFGLGGIFGAAIVLGGAAWMCDYASRSRIDLVNRVTEMNVKRRRLQRYFSPGIANLLEEEPDEALTSGKECELTVLVTDIRGFTRMSEDLNSEEVVEFLNAYYARMVEVIFRNGGTLDKFLGDGILAYFNAPIAYKDHATRALRCAQEMVEELKGFNADRILSGSAENPVRIGVGIHTGRGVVGVIGVPNRREYTAIGDAVNVATAIEAKTKDFENIRILLSETTVSCLEEKDDLVDVGTIPFAKRRESLRLWGVPTKKGREMEL